MTNIDRRSKKLPEVDQGVQKKTIAALLDKTVWEKDRRKIKRL